MSNVEDWSVNAGSNNNPAPNGFPEGMPPSGVNDAAREVMAAIKRWYDAVESGSFQVANAANADNAANAANAALLQGQNSAYHLARANHTGTQAVSTITGLGPFAPAAKTQINSADLVANFLESLIPVGIGGTSFYWAAFGCDEDGGRTSSFVIRKSGVITLSARSDDGVEFTLTRDEPDTETGNVPINQPAPNAGDENWNIVGASYNLTVNKGEVYFLNYLRSYGPGISNAALLISTGNDCIIPPVL